MAVWLLSIFEKKTEFASASVALGTGQALWKASGVDLDKAKGPRYRDTGQGMGPALNTAASDSYELRKAGASQVLVGSDHQARAPHFRHRQAKEGNEAPREPALNDLLEKLHLDVLDPVIVEGFKMAPIPKIETHRPSLAQPLLADPDIIAVATCRSAGHCHD
jgi:molybdopterin-guanine dinucleotide biosynthesis protein MobB